MQLASKLTQGGGGIWHIWQIGKSVSLALGG